MKFEPHTLMQYAFMPFSFFADIDDDFEYVTFNAFPINACIYKKHLVNCYEYGRTYERTILCEIV